MLKSSIKINRRAPKKVRLKKKLSGKNESEKITCLTELVSRLSEQKSERYGGENDPDKRIGDTNSSERTRTSFKDKMGSSLDRLEMIWSRDRIKVVGQAAAAKGAERIYTEKSVIGSPPQKTTGSESDYKKKAMIGDLANKSVSSVDEKRLSEFKKSCSSLKSASTSSLSSEGKKGKSIFTSDKLGQIESCLKGLAINGYLDKIELIEYDLDETIKNYTTNELAEFERNLKEQRVRLDLYLFTTRHFYESIQQDALDAIESVDLISKWATIKDEKIEFWSKLNQSVYMKIEIESGNYDLVIKDEQGNLIKFAKENFHQVVRTFATKIANCDHLIKSLDHYVDKIIAKKQLTALNLTNLYNFKAKKAAHKYLGRSKGGA